MYMGMEMGTGRRARALRKRQNWKDEAGGSADGYNARAGVQ